MPNQLITHSHKDLIVWQKSMDLVVAIYKLTDKFPKSELYGITSQMRRSSVAIPSNIAEGRKRGGVKEYRHFLIIAISSAVELETQIELSKRLGFAKAGECTTVDSLLSEILKMLTQMIKTLSPIT